MTERRRPTTVFAFLAAVTAAVTAGLGERDGVASSLEQPKGTPQPLPSRSPNPRRVQGLTLEQWRWRAVRNRIVINRQRRAIRWLSTVAQKQRAQPVTVGVNYWVAKQIAAAEVLAREAGADPWPNCPDPYDGSGGSWSSTVACENSGSWLDSPGFYRCGLQFDPIWERRFGRLCP